MAHVNEPEKLKMLKKCRVREHGVTAAKPVKAGDVIIVSGEDKIELLSRGLAEPVTTEAKK